MSDDDLIRLYVLGPPRIEGVLQNASDLLLASPKLVGLLTYLALPVPGTLHQRDTVLGRFWPDIDQAHAQASLRKSLYRIRRAMSENGGVGDDPRANDGATEADDNGPIMKRGDGLVGINPSVVWCDVAAFEQAAEDGEYQRANHLYRGELLAGMYLSGLVEYERWLEGERARLRHKAVQTAWASAEADEAKGNWEDAAFLARHAAGLAPDDETVLQRLIAFLDHVGDRAGALREYDRFSRYLWQEFDAEPSAETQELIEAVRKRASANRKMERVPDESGTDALRSSEGVSATHLQGAGDGPAIETRVQTRWTAGIAFASLLVAGLGFWLILPMISDDYSEPDGGEGVHQTAAVDVLGLTAEECAEAVRQIFIGSHDRARVPGLLDRALQLDPNLARVHALRSIWLTNQAMAGPAPEHLDSAREEAELALNLDSTDYMAHAALGYAHRFSSDRYAQLRALATSIDLAPDSITPRRMLGLYYNANGQVHLGAAWWALATPSVSGRLFRAVQYWYVGDYDRAEREQENMVALERRGARRLLAGIYLSQGKLLEAKAQIEQALRDRPDSRAEMAAVLTTAALIETFAGAWSAAREHLDAVMDLEPPVLVVANNGIVTSTLLAYVLTKQGDVDRAAEMLQASVDLDTEALRSGITYTAHHYHDLARVHSMRGNVSEANRWLRQAIEHGWFFSYTYMGERDPMLETLRGSREFETMMEECRRELSRQRELMMEMETLNPDELLTLLLDELHADLNESQPS